MLGTQAGTAEPMMLETHSDWFWEGSCCIWAWREGGGDPGMASVISELCCGHSDTTLRSGQIELSREKRLIGNFNQKLDLGLGSRGVEQNPQTQVRSVCLRSPLFALFIYLRIVCDSPHMQGPASINGWIKAACMKPHRKKKSSHLRQHRWT